MTIFQAVEKAVEGGYSEPCFIGKNPEERARIIGDMVLPEILLDRNFWQSLGKAMGWEEFPSAYFETDNDWRTHWHRFIDHLAEGKDAEQFFSNL